MHRRIVVGWLCVVMTLCSAHSFADDLSHAKALSKAFREASRKVMPAVVTITVFVKPGQRRIDRNLGDAEGDQINREPIPMELGSGVIVSSDGWVLTNHHVIANAERIEVETFVQQKLPVEKVLGDPSSDMAILKVKADSALPIAELGSSDELEIGDWVLAIGSPFQLQSSVSAGIISAKGRTIPRIRRGLLLQTDAAINPGNSGGPLIDLEGRIVGISTAIATQGGGYEGVGFAITAEQASWIYRELRDHGAVRRASLGVKISFPTPEAGFAPGTEGAMVIDVVRNSPAAKAGILQKDLIVEFAGVPIRTYSDLPRHIERLPTDQSHAMRIVREGKSINLTVQLSPVVE